MGTKNIALAYCIDNLKAAENIAQALEPTNYHFDHFYCKKNQTDAPLSEQLRNYDGAILLLVSDNFLRSVHCMNRALQLIQSKSAQILPVVVDGFKRDQHTGEIEKIETRFEKIGDIIPYINYWQNQYLDLRSQRKRLEREDDLNKESFSEHLRIVRQVSSEASEFLRVLRNMNYVDFDQLTYNHFKALFDFIEDDLEWEAFRAKVTEVNLSGEDVISIEETEELLDTEPEEEAEEPEVELGEIPGLHMLEGRDNISKIIKNTPQPPQEASLDESEEEEPAPVLPNEEEEEFDLKLEDAHQPENLDDKLEGEDEDEEDEDEGENAGGMPRADEHHTTIEEVEADSNADQPEKDPDSSSSLTVESENDELENGQTIDFDFEDDDSYDEEEDEEDETGELSESNNEEKVEVEQLINASFNQANNGQVEAALSAMHQGVKQYPENTDLRYHYALMLAQNTSNFPAAINQLYTLLEYAPDNVDAHFLLGELAELEENYDKAAAFYKQVINLDSNYPDAHYRLGVVLLNHFPDAAEKAAKHLKKAWKRNPEQIDACYQYALLMNERLGKPRKAIKYLHKTLDIQPEHPFANYDLALLYYQHGEKEKASRYYQRAIELNPELQTPENDLAFAIDEQTPEASNRFAHTAGIANEQDTIDALKQNIRRLEELLQSKSFHKMAMAPEPPNKIVFITGATSGIGKATAIVFAKNGYKLILNGRRTERLEGLQQELKSQFNTVSRLLPFDVRDFEAASNAINSLEPEWRNIDILVNNAGKAKGLSGIHEGALHHWEEMIDVNLKGLLYLTRLVSPLMVERQKGHIINIGSIAGKEVYPKGNVYNATKFAVDALTRAMRLDLHMYNIRVSQVSPGHVEETEFALVRFDGDAERAKIYEDFKAITSTDVAGVVYFMATQPPHVNIQDVLMMGTQQASATTINRSGRAVFEEE